jgi:subtilisin family serine protease
VDADISSTKAGNGRGRVSNVNAYVIDTGIYAHRDLNVVNHVNFTGDGRNYDCDGHGTHVAGTVAAKDDARAVVGAAPGAPLTGVKVLGCDGAGLTSRTIEGIDWVTANAVRASCRQHEPKRSDEPGARRRGEELRGQRHTLLDSGG